MLPKLLAATALLPLVCAFLDTVPLIAWSSHENTLVSALNEQRVGESRIENLPLQVQGDDDDDDDICGFDAVIVIEQPGLHAHDLKTLSPSSSIPTRLRNADKSKSVQIPYVRRHATEDVLDVAEKLARRCGAMLQWVNKDGEFVVDDDRDRDRDSDENGKGHVLYVSLPEVYGEGSWRRHQMLELEESLSRTLTEIETSFSKHLIIYTGSLSSDLTKRQSISSDPTTMDQPFSFAPSNSTLSTGTGILARYQLLTPGLILSLFIAFFLLVPAVLLSVRALASIQSSVRLDAPKGPSQSKKNQ